MGFLVLEPADPEMRGGAAWEDIRNLGMTK